MVCYTKIVKEAVMNLTIDDWRTLALTFIILFVVVFFVLIIIGIIYFYKKYSKRIVKEKDGIRYTVSDKTKDEQGQVATYIKGDIILKPDKIYIAGKDFKPGRYNVLSSMENLNKVTLKVNGVSRSQEHNTGIIFMEGDIIIAEKYAIILR